jgi:hypothetical protein
MKKTRGKKSRVRAPLTKILYAQNFILPGAFYVNLLLISICAIHYTGDFYFILTKVLNTFGIK